MEQYFKKKYFEALEQRLELESQISTLQTTISDLRNSSSDTCIKTETTIDEKPQAAPRTKDTMSPFQKYQNAKMDILESGILVKRACGDCKLEYTSGHWCLDKYVNHGHVCQKCYRRRRRCIRKGVSDDYFRMFSSWY